MEQALRDKMIKRDEKAYLLPQKSCWCCVAPRHCWWEGGNSFESFCRTAATAMSSQYGATRKSLWCFWKWSFVNFILFLLMQFTGSLSFLWEGLTVNLAWAEHVLGLAVICSKCAGKGRYPTCLSEWCASLSKPFSTSVSDCVTVGGEGKGWVQEKDGSSVEMWNRGLHPQCLIWKSKDCCLCVTLCGRD